MMEHPERNAPSFVEYITLGNTILSIVVYLSISILWNLIQAPSYPKSVPWVGHGKGWVAGLRNVFAGLTQSKTWFHEGYEKYSKHGKTFILPAILGAPAETIIPQSQVRWMLDQPDNVLSTGAAHYEILHGEYSFVKPIIVRDPYHEHIIHKHLARSMNAILPELNDEVCRGVDELCGLDTENFKKFDMLEGFMMPLVPKVTNRMLVGEPLCRNQEFLGYMLAYTMDVIRGMIALAVVPKALHPIAGNLLALGPKYRYWKSAKFTIPLIKKRTQDIKNKDAGHPDYKDWREPIDFVTWSIRTAMAEGRQDELTPGRIAMRIMPLNFASIHTTAITGYAALSDILASDPSVVEELREEVERVFKEEGGTWTKPGLLRLHKMDSAIRESQRYSPISLTFLNKKVLVKEGITSPERVHFPYGTIMSAPWSGVANDGSVYDHADAYDAFRFSREREEFETKANEGKEQSDGLKLKQSGMVTTTETHYAFGHGRHACPGRFFVSHELKMIFAHLLMHYEVNNLAGKPTEIWIGKTKIPAKIDLEVRRRKVA